MTTWEPKVGDGACICTGSDRDPCTVIARTAKSITLRDDRVTHENGEDVFHQDIDGTVHIARLTQNGWRIGGKRGMPVGNYRSSYRDPSF